MGRKPAPRNGLGETREQSRRGNEMREERERATDAALANHAANQQRGVSQN